MTYFNLNNWLLINDLALKDIYASLPPSFFKNERWFSDRDAKADLHLVETLQFQKAQFPQSFLTLNIFEIGEGRGYYYYIPLLISFGKPWFAIEHIFEKDGYYFFDGISSYEYISLMEELWRSGQTFKASGGTFEFLINNKYLKNTKFHLHGSSSNSLLFVYRQYLIKNYRRLYPGTNPELKIYAALAKKGSDKIPELYGFFQFHDVAEVTLGIVQEIVDNDGTGWDIWGILLKEPGTETVLVKQAISLGEALSELHTDLALIAQEEGRIQPLDYAFIEARIRTTLKILENDLATYFKEDFVTAINGVNLIATKLMGKNLGSKFLIHGDLHLEQVLATSNGWKVLDFEGEPLKTIEEREQYDSPLKDLASMLRSISYRAHCVFDDPVMQTQAERLLLTGLITGYIDGYNGSKAAPEDIRFLPDKPELDLLLAFFQIERAVYECIYELKCRPDWFSIPFQGLKRLLDQVIEKGEE